MQALFYHFYGSKIDYYSGNIVIIRTGITTMRVRTTMEAGMEATTFDNLRAGMIKLVVKEVAEKEGITNPLELSRLSGLPYETCRRAWNDDASQIGLKTIERLCDVLRVGPGQLFEYYYEPDKPQRKRKR